MYGGLPIAASNNPDDIDDAMLRTGRFDAKIKIPKPDGEARLRIFAEHLDAPTEGVDREKVLRATSGFTASDMEAVADRAARTAANRARTTGRDTEVTASDIFEAIDDIDTEREGVGEFVERPPDQDLSDVVGMEGLKSTLQEKIIDPLENPELHDQYGIGIESGFLLYGPPGTGKTHVSKCLAGELGVSFINAKAGDLVSKWIGEGAENVQQMFDEARENQPCVVFVDEIDALATDRGTQQTKSEQQMVNQFLEEMTQVNDEDHDIVVIGATNRIEQVDDAMLRTGRFSEKIEVPPPKDETRVELLKAHLDAPRAMLDEDAIASQTRDFVASDMENVAERAAYRAADRAKESCQMEEVTQEDVEAAIAEVGRK